MSSVDILPLIIIIINKSYNHNHDHDHDLLDILRPTIFCKFYFIPHRRPAFCQSLSNLVKRSTEANDHDDHHGDDHDDGHGDDHHDDDDDHCDDHHDHDDGDDLMIAIMIFW